VSKRKLLLADDSVTIQKVVNLTFADEGIDVITVGDGNAAIAKISEIAPDVILADVHMPGLSGYQVCEMVRSNEATRKLPVVLLVGSFEPFDETEAARVGANAYLTKPFQSIRQLVSQVSELIRTSSPQAEEPPSAPVQEVHDVDVTSPPNIHDTSDPNIDVTVPADAPAKKSATNDIDSLYARSVGGPGQYPAPAGSGVHDYVDAGMDDEIIETTHAEQPVEEEPAYVEPATVEQSAAEEPSYVEPATVDDSAEQEQSYAGPAMAEDPIELEPAYAAPATMDFAFTADPTPEEQPITEFGYDDEPTSQYDYSEPQIDTAPTEPLHPISPFDSPAEVETNVATATEPDSHIDQFAKTQSVAGSGESSEKQFVVDEDDPLELPPLDDGRTIELTTSEGKKELVSLSPELMDMLVERVKKELSEKS
jgi:CheY-like chemotaxis protein